MPMMSSRLYLALLLALGVATHASAKDFLPVIVYDFGGKFDRSFNQSASEGAQKFKADTGVTYREFEITNAAQREQFMAQAAKRGATIIVAIGFTQASAVEKVARQFPEVKFTIIDAGGQNQCVYLTDGASLTGFTLRNGVGLPTGGVKA